MTLLRNIIQHLESIAPPIYQEDYDNAGLLVGSPDMEVKGVLVSLDATEAIIDEAVARDCNVVVAHHPIIFKGLKRLTGRNYVERTVIKAIQKGVAIYAIHTNLDNVYHQGVNAKIAEKLGLTDTRILAPRQLLKKLSCYIAPAHSDAIRVALLEAGIGEMQVHNGWSFSTLGVVNYEGTGATQVKIEALFAVAAESAVRKALQNYSAEAVAAFDISEVENHNATVGSGMVGVLPKPMKEEAFLKFLKKEMQAGCVRHTALLGRNVEKVAVCGGAGGFLLGHAIGAGADVFVTSDYKYHEFFDADGKIVIADIGHFESEQFTIELLATILSEKFSTFAVHCAETVTNPVQYL